MGKVFVNELPEMERYFPDLDQLIDRDCSSPEAVDAVTCLYKGDTVRFDRLMEGKRIEICLDGHLHVYLSVTAFRLEPTGDMVYYLEIPLIWENGYLWERPPYPASIKEARRDTFFQTSEVIPEISALLERGGYSLEGIRRPSYVGYYPTSQSVSVISESILGMDIYLAWPGKPPLKVLGRVACHYNRVEDSLLESGIDPTREDLRDMLVLEEL